MIELRQLSQIVEHGRSREVVACVKSLLQAGLSPEQIFQEGIIPGLSEVGKKFDQHEIFIPEMLLAARTVKLANEVMQTMWSPLLPRLGKRIVLGTVAGDLHDIGKNLVAQAMYSVGIGVIDLGVDVPAEQFVQAAEQDETVAFVGVSALLTTTLPAMTETVRALRTCRAAERIRILVGGAPVTQTFAKTIGADIYTETAFEAAKAARAVLESELGGSSDG